MIIKEPNCTDPYTCTHATGRAGIGPYSIAHINVEQNRPT